MKSLKKAFGIGKKEEEKAPLVTEGTVVEILVPQGPVTNLHSKNTFSNQELTTVLSNLSVGDARHDFGFKVNGEELNNERFKNAFCYGISADYTATLNEAQCLASVVNSYTP